MAEAFRLTGFADLSLIVDYAAKFGLDPDEVFWKTGFDTVINTLCLMKERDEYNERFTTIWRMMQEG